MGETVPDYVVPVLGFKSGDPAAEADTTDWTLGIVAEEGSKLGGGEIIDISPDSEYYEWSTFDGYNMGRYVVDLDGGTGYAYEDATLALDMQDKLSSLSKPCIVLGIALDGHIGIRNAAYSQSYVRVEIAITGPGGGFWIPYRMIQYREELIGTNWLPHLNTGGPYFQDVSDFKSQEMRIRFRLARRDTNSSTTNYAYLEARAILAEVVG